MTRSTITRHTGTIQGRYHNATLLDCDNCGFIHVDPLPSEAELATFYGNTFYEEKSDYLTKMEAELAYWESVIFEDRLDVLNRLLSESRQKGRILDIGCSGGFFLNFMKRHGWDAIGIEPSRQAASYCREQWKIPVLEQPFQQTTLDETGGPVHVVHLRNVMEHLPDPAALCQKAYEMLHPGGIICIEVPNDFNALQHLANNQLGTGEYWVAITHHLNYFTPQSLSNLVQKHGFTPVYTTATFPMELFLLMGENYVGNNPLGLACHTKRMNLEMMLSKTPESRELRHKLYEAFACLNLGRTIIIYAQKKLK